MSKSIIRTCQAQHSDDYSCEKCIDDRNAAAYNETRYCPKHDIAWRGYGVCSMCAQLPLVNTFLEKQKALNPTLKHKLIMAALTGVLSNPYTLNDEKVVVDAIFSVVDNILKRLEEESK